MCTSPERLNRFVVGAIGEAVRATDAAILSSLVDGTILVVDAGRTRRGAVGNGREALAKVGARVLGVALNRLSESMAGGYYYYDYYGGYGSDAKSTAKGEKAAGSPKREAGQA